MKKANDFLNHYTSTESYYKHPFGMVYTDGVQELCKRFQCFWFLDIVVSYQKGMKDEEFQTWKLTRHIDNTATVECTDGNDNILRTQQIPLTDFECQEAIVWVSHNTILLPSEY